MSRFTRVWLAPARIPPPALDESPQHATAGSLEIRAEPIRPEDAAWNAWPGETSRLFNNRAGIFFAISVSGPSPIRWLPAETRLELGQDLAITPAPNADELLVPLITAALTQERSGIDGDLVERTRAAGPYRSAYLPREAKDGRLDGVVAFPLVDPEMQVVAMRLTLGFATPTGVERVQFLYE